MLTVASVLSSGAHAAAKKAAPLLTISVGRSATGTVVLPSAVLDWSRLATSPTVSYLALYFEPLDQKVAAVNGPGGFIADATRFDKQPSLVVDLGVIDAKARLGDGPRFALQTPVRGGRYVVHVITPQAVTVTLPLVNASHAMHVQLSGGSADYVGLQQMTPTPMPGAPGAASGRFALPQPPHALTHTMTILRTTSTAERMTTSLSGCRRDTTPQDGAADTTQVTGPIPACTSNDDGDAWGLYDSSQRDYQYLPPVPVLIPQGAASSYIWVNSYYHRVARAAQLADVESADNIRAAYAASVVIGLQR